MTFTVFKIRSSLEGGRVRVAFFCGQRGFTMAFLGALMMIPAEWELFSRIMESAMEAPGFPERCLIVREGEDEVRAQLRSAGIACFPGPAAVPVPAGQEGGVRDSGDQP